MDRNEIIERFVSALRTCVKNDRSLIWRKVHERAITASLACYMRPLFREFDVDVEYNLGTTLFGSNWMKPKTYIVDNQGMHGTGIRVYKW